MATVVHSVHCMMGLDSLPATAGTEMSVEEQVDRLFNVRNRHCLKYIDTHVHAFIYLFNYLTWNLSKVLSHKSYHTVVQYKEAWVAVVSSLANYM